MNIERSVELLGALQAEAATLPASVSSTEFNSWQQRTRSILTKSLGETHAITRAFIGISWTPVAYAVGDRSAFAQTFQRRIPKAQGLIESAIFELQELRDSADISDEAGYGSELWEHVGVHVAAGEWGKLASQTAIFTEDRIRKWAGRPAEEVGEKLMTAVYGENGEYKLGLTTGEKQGWHRLAMGISMALRNADAHRIQSRPDHKRYAMGVLGVSSLLLTQTRYEHGNRFKDTSPAVEVTDDKG